MPSISKKGLQMPESPIRKLVPYAEQAKKNGNHVHHLNIGQPDIETPKIALDAIKNFKDNVVEYSHSAGFESYRKKLCNYYKEVGINVNSSDIIITMESLVDDLIIMKDDFINTFLEESTESIKNINQILIW